MRGLGVGRFDVVHVLAPIVRLAQQAEDTRQAGHAPLIKLNDEDD